MCGFQFSLTFITKYFAKQNYQYYSFDLEKMTVNCNCKVKHEVNDELGKGNFENYIEKTFLDSKFGVIKWYNLVCNLKGKLDYYGFFFFGILTLIHIHIYILYFINGIIPVKNYIIKEMSNKGYEPNKNLKNENNQIYDYIQEITKQNIRAAKMKKMNKLKRKSFVIIKKGNNNLLDCSVLKDIKQKKFEKIFVQKNLIFCLVVERRISM